MTQSRRYTSSPAQTKFFNERGGAPGDIPFRPDAPSPKITLLDYSQSGFQKVDIHQPVECQLHWHINLKAFSSLFELTRSA